MTSRFFTILLLAASTYFNVGVCSGQDSLVVFDLATGSESIRAFDTISISHTLPSDTGRLNGHFQFPEEINAPSFSPFQLARSSYNIFDFPVRTSVTLSYTSDTVSNSGFCSGTLVGSNLVLTAGHCIAWENQSGNWVWNTGLSVLPGMDEGLSSFPLLVSKPEKLIVLKSYYDVNLGERNDFGLIVLNKPIGLELGWQGVALAEIDSVIELKKRCFAFSVPATQPYTGMDMYHGSGSITDGSLSGTFYSHDAVSGESGAGLFRPLTQRPYIFGIQAFSAYGFLLTEKFLGMLNYSKIHFNEQIVNLSPRLTPTAVSLFPNPSGSKISISGICSDKIRQISFKDTNGAKVNQREITGFSNNIDVSFLAPGLYFIQILDVEGRTHNLRFIKK